MSRGLLEILGSLFAGRRKGEDGRAAPPLTLSADADTAGIYGRNPSASILASVLSDGKETPSARIKEKPATSAAQTLGVGEELRKAREAVFAAGEALAGLCDDTITGHIRRLMSVVENQHCSIAFIGQMNAGKSSLINAFIGAPHFLPAEITPWTTVVTNLYFGIPHMPVGGALFEFFSRAEWQQLAEGSSRVRALTERLVPDFRWDDFYRQVGSMREKAEEKLGARYASLLGTQHSFPLVTTEILEKYIAAESPLGEEGAGEYSMITKAAHLYFDLASFLYPTVVIDTPGVNDPFLVRDEITRQNLERANIFVIVVTARQPLSNADLDLLRILRGLKKDHIVIFVNKVDEIEDFPAHSSAIAERIRGVLSREFPGANIPIVMGSAFWAEVALGDDADGKQCLAHTLNVEAERAPTIAEAAPGFWPTDPSTQADLVAESILMRSGIPDLALEVSEILKESESAGSIRYAAAVLAALAKNGAARAEKLAALQSLSAGEADGQMARLDEAARALQDIDAAIALAERRFSDVAAEYAQALKEIPQTRMKASIAAYTSADTARPELAAFHLTSLVAHLRNELEQEFLRLFHEALSQIKQIARETETALGREIGGAAERLEIPIAYAPLPVLSGSPSLTALGEPVATDLGGLLHGRWEKGRPTPEQTEQMKAMIEAQFENITAQLALAASDELNRTRSFILDHFRVTVSHTLRIAIEEQRRAHKAPAKPTNVGTQNPRGVVQSYRKIADALAPIAVHGVTADTPSPATAR